MRSSGQRVPCRISGACCGERGTRSSHRARRFCVFSLPSRRQSRYELTRDSTRRRRASRRPRGFRQAPSRTAASLHLGEYVSERWWCRCQGTVGSRGQAASFTRVRAAAVPAREYSPWLGSTVSRRRARRCRHRPPRSHPRGGMHARSRVREPRFHYFYRLIDTALRYLASASVKLRQVSLDAGNSKLVAEEFDILASKERVWLNR